MGKITVKHYLDKRLKATAPSKDEVFIKTTEGYCYPLYVQVICKRQNTKFRSHIKPSNSVAEFGIHKIDVALDNTSNLQLRKPIEKEKQSIQAVISLLRPFENDGFHLAGFSTVYEMAIIDLKYLIGNHCRRRMNKLFMSSKSKDFGGIIDWDLGFQTISKGLNKVIISKAPGGKGFRERTEEINTVFEGYNGYAQNKTISFYEWFIDDHQKAFQEFLNRKRKSNFKKVGKVVEKIIEDHFEELLKQSTNGQWMSDNKYQFGKFLKNAINEL